MPGQLISNDIDVMADGILTGWELGACLSLSGSYSRTGALYSGDGELLENLPASVSLFPKNAGKTKRVKALIDFLISIRGDKDDNASFSMEMHRMALEFFFTDGRNRQWILHTRIAPHTDIIN